MPSADRVYQTDAEILAQVAERVLGRYKSTVGGVPVWAARYDDYLLMKNFHLDWRLIGLVVEAMRGKGWQLDLTDHGDYWSAVWFRFDAAIAPMPRERTKQPTAPRAVLLAALKAMEGK